MPASLPCPTLREKSAAISDDQVRSLFHELPHFLQSVIRLKIETNAVVDAAVSKVAVYHAAIVVGFGQLAEFAQISAQLLRSDCGVFPSFPRCRLPGNVRNRAQRRFSDFPGLSRQPLVAQQPKTRWPIVPAECLH